MPEHVPEVLFVCVHNAGRSQMAAALLTQYAGDRVVVRSGGTAPADTINPTVVAAIAEVGIDLDSNGSPPKRLTDTAVEASDVVITMGCGDACPFTPVSAISNGISTIRPAGPSRKSDAFATRSTSVCRHSSRSSDSNRRGKSRAGTRAPA